MEDLLTTRQVLEILKVDRITIYRMLQDGRLKGNKIGQQWRFARKDVENLVGESSTSSLPQLKQAPSFPTHCAQTIQDLFAGVAQVSALIIDTDGLPLTKPSLSCRLCQALQQSPAGLMACQASWKEAARHSASGQHFFTCHAGLQYISAPILDGEKAVGYFLAGEFYWRPPDVNAETECIHRMAKLTNIPLEFLQTVAHSLPIIPIDRRLQVESWPPLAATAVQSILHERTNFIERLQQIANLTQIHQEPRL